MPIFLMNFGFMSEQGKIATVLGVNPPSRFGELKLENDEVVEFAEKPDFADNWINGGYFFFKRDVLQYLSDGRRMRPREGATR